MRDLGELGELCFNKWCVEADLVANKSTKDMMGWDFLVEFPQSNEIAGQQIHISAPKFKVQVKATDGQKRKLAIKLDNLRKLAIDPLPSFICFIEFDGTNDPTRIFIKPFDEVLIEKVLRVVATTENQTLTVHYDDANCLEYNSGEALSKFVKSWIGNFPDYLAHKISILESVGYDRESLNIRFLVSGQDKFEELVDVHLGIKEKVEVSSIAATVKRFGIETERADLSSDSAELSIVEPKPATEGTLIFRKGKLQNDYRFKVEVYVPHFLADFNHPLFKSRLKSNFFDLTIKHSEKTLDFKFNFDNKRFTLRELRIALKFIADISTGEKYKLLLNGKNGQEVLGSISSNSKRVDYSNKIEAIDSLIRIAQLFSITEKALVSLDEIEYLSTSSNAVSELFSGNANGFKIAFNVEELELDVEESVVVLGVLTYSLGGQLLYFMYSAEGKVAKSTETIRRYELVSPIISVFGMLSSEISSPLAIKDLFENLDEIAKEYDDKTVIILRD